ncbi:hypothetical protein [Shewanella sp. MBTL60-007]|uniref:hypothetical protein n=1 Tax=Shewanella sp. MBTL60-007 TaxID=2815911 RepID=UPI001BC3AB7F|nr:hypothetical protein [Shewanella sp. MBTL60-007]GIU24330.1 hypothetical protein TUM3792_28970 [Shewanella sp. MBTL60-007]
MANYRFICAFILSGCMFSQHAMSQEKVSSECASKYGIAIDGCTTKSGYTELFLERYNIHSVDVKSSYDKALDSNRAEIRDLVKRYKQTYNQLNSVGDKLSFVNLFLSRVTDKYNLTLKLGNGYDESIKVIVNGSRGYNDLPVGYVISLFGNDIISDEAYNLYFRYLSMLNSNSFTQNIAEDVTYVLNGYTNSINEVAFKK